RRRARRMPHDREPSRDSAVRARHLRRQPSPAPRSPGTRDAPRRAVRPDPLRLLRGDRPRLAPCRGRHARVDPLDPSRPVREHPAAGQPAHALAASRATEERRDRACGANGPGRIVARRRAAWRRLVIDVDTIGENMPLLEGIRTTRALRRLRPDPVPPAPIRKVSEARTFAPSGGNRQPWLFIAVPEPERRRWVAERYRPLFHRYIAPAVEAARSPDYPDAKRNNMRAAIWLADHLHEVPVHLFVAGWTRRGAPQLQALFPAVQNVLLACRAVGLGASLTQLHLAAGREVDAWLGLPEGCPTCALIPIGWPR